jgi:predicted ribosome quality control (RQC) complex YloA/Tae2 family protein
MKTSTAALELAYIVKELQVLISSKVDKIYHPSEKEILFQLHMPNQGKIILRVLVPSFIYLTQKKAPAESPSNFCMFLRKRLDSARIREIKQLGFERIIQMDFETKEQKFRMFIELFSKGNIVLCTETNEIINVLDIQHWKGREIRKGETYNLPVKRFDLMDIDESKFAEVVKKSEKESIVKTLAIETGLGGIYAEEVCYLAGVDKNKKEASSADVSKLFRQIRLLTNTKPKPTAYYKDGSLVDITPFEIESFKDMEKKQFDTYSEALDSADLNAKPKQNKQLEKQLVIIQSQEEKLIELEKKIKQNSENGGLIYERYQDIEGILKELKKAREKYSWKEIKEKLKDHKVIKEINESKKEIVLEL